MTAPEFKTARQDTGLSQGQFAEYLGVGAWSVANWERGRRRVPEYARLALLRVPWWIAHKGRAGKPGPLPGTAYRTRIDKTKPTQPARKAGLGLDYKEA